MAKLERIYTVPLGDAYETIRRKRTPRAVKLLRAFIGRHMKADGEKIVLSGALNGYLWQHSIAKPPRRVKVRLIKDEGKIRAYLADEKVEEPKKEEKKAEEKKEAPKVHEKKPEAAKPEPKAEAAKKPEMKQAPRIEPRKHETARAPVPKKEEKI